MHATLHRSLAVAVRWQRVTRNAAALANPPRVPRPELAVWSAEQLRSFLDAVADDPLRSLWHVYARTGVRRGEALALRWADLDLTARRAAIRRALVPTNRGLQLTEPKTEKGRRAIALDEELVVELHAHRRRQLEERLLMGDAYHDQDLVFPRADGTPINPDYISRMFTRLVRQNRLPQIRLHDLRHTHATLALRAGVATKVVNERLGHSATAVTSDVYQHVLPDLDEDAAERVAELLRPPEDPLGQAQ